MADVLISGGGVAGSAAAILLARQGRSVDLFECGTFPKEKPCGEGIMPGGIAVLERMGLAEAVGGEPFIGVRYHFGNQTAQGRFPSTKGTPVVGRAQRRWRLDRALFEAAKMTPGVTAHTSALVERPLLENGRVVGLIVEGAAHRAPLVVAADGLHSRIRNALGLNVPARRKRLGVRCHFRLASRMEHEPWVDVFVSRGHELYVTALPDRELLVAALVNAETLGESIELAFRHWCDAQPEIASRLQGAEQISRLLCTSPLSGRAHRGVAPGVVLLGDAAGFIDPITGGGITQALMTAELLAQHVRVGATDPDQWIWDFERERQLLLRDYHRVTKAVLWLAYHPAASESLLRVLGLAPRILSHLVGVAAGIAPLLGSRANRQAFETAHQVGKGRILRPPDTAGGDRMYHLSVRNIQTELLDEGRLPTDEVRRALMDIRRINRRFGARRVLLTLLAKEISTRGLKEFTVLDVASGSCDHPMAIIDWAKQHGLRAQVFALDFQHRHLRLFRDEFAAYPNLHAFCADAFNCPVLDHAFDFVICSHFLHHLTGDQAIALLSAMKRWARRGVIAVDLERHPVSYYFFRIFSRGFTNSYVSRTDGRITLEQSFRKDELGKTAQKAGLADCTVIRYWPFLLGLVSKTEEPLVP